MKMWRTQISGFLKNEDYKLPQLLKMKIAFLKLLKTEELKTHIKNVKKMKTMLCAGSEIAHPSFRRMEFEHSRLIYNCLMFSLLIACPRPFPRSHFWETRCYAYLVVVLKSGKGYHREVVRFIILNYPSWVYFILFPCILLYQRH